MYLKNDVPRRIGDDKPLNGTLNLMESLFDQDKINEHDFTFLINAFTQIQCFDAVKILKGIIFFFEIIFHSILFILEHERRMLLNGLSQSTQSLASMMPPTIDELLDDEEDCQGSRVDRE